MRFREYLEAQGWDTGKLGLAEFQQGRSGEDVMGEKEEEVKGEKV